MLRAPGAFVDTSGGVITGADGRLAGIVDGCRGCARGINGGGGGCRWIEVQSADVGDNNGTGFC